jgi:hypothetical protein
MNRNDADHQLTQFRKIRIEVDADSFVSVEPTHPQDILVEHADGTWVIHGYYGFDLFQDHRFVILVDGELIVYDRIESIPEVFDNVIEFIPDPTHDATFCYTFVKDGQSFTHTHWVHHDTDPWGPVLQALLKRETNGRYHARSHKNRRPRHPPLLTDDSDAGLP